MKVHKAQDHKEELGISRNTIELVEKIGNGRYAQVHFYAVPCLVIIIYVL